MPGFDTEGMYAAVDARRGLRTTSADFVEPALW